MATLNNVDSISRFARNTKDLLELVDQLNNKGIIFVSLKEAILLLQTQGYSCLQYFGAVAQLERDYIKDVSQLNYLSYGISIIR